MPKLMRTDLAKNTEKYEKQWKTREALVDDAVTEVLRN
jgi:hypothetical protein